MADSGHDTSRRRFLKQAAGTGVVLGALGCGSGSATGAQAASESTEVAQAGASAAGGTIPKIRLGKTGTEVSVLGAGTAHTVTPILLNRTLDAGITYIDTAEGYGSGASERAIGKILKANGRRDECWIVTKTGDHDWRNLENHVDGSLERLQTDRVDILYLHNLGKPELLNGEMEAAAARLIETGKVLHFGFSTHHPNLLACLNKAAETDFVEVIMFKYNFRDYNNEQLNAAIDACHAADIGLVAMKTQGGAVSFQDRVDPFKQRGLNRFQATLKGVYEDERISAIVSAMKNVRQVEENSAAAVQPALSAQERQALEEYRLASADLYCSGHCAQECMPRVAADTNVPDIMRHLMYYENYGDRRAARTLFGRLPANERAIRGVDFSQAEAACPYGLAIGEMMERAETLLV